MIRSSFTVVYKKDRKTNYVTGVTSIVPNLNGLLFFTEDGRNHFIESHNMKMEGAVPTKGLTIEYLDEDDIAFIYKLAEREPSKYEVFDHIKN